VSYVNWSLAYQGAMRGDDSTLDLNLAANFGLRGFINSPDEFAYNRYNAEPNYFYLRGGFRYVRALPFPGSLVARLDGQLAFEPLISNEQFAIGGAESVRGYLEAEQLGDRGLSGTLEWDSPQLPPVWGDWLGGSYGLLFVDGGVVSIIDALPGQDASTNLLSAGAGVRLLPFDGLVANLDWAYPFLTANPTQAGDWRMLFQVKYDF
jgi:hemolysin activation/secretion protein